MINYPKKMAIAIFAILMVACGDDKSKKSDVLADTEGSVGTFDSPAFITKYNKYIEFGNSFHQRVGDSYRRYFEWADPEKGPDTKRPGGIYTLYDHSIEHLEEAIGLRPKIDKVDGGMSLVLKKAKTLNDLCREADKYYTRQDYKDDGFAKGKELHPKLVLAFDEYYQAYDRMFADFSILQDELFKHDLERYKKDGQTIRYNLMLNLHKAEKMMAVIGNREIDQLTDSDIEQMTKFMQEFRGSLSELESLSTDKDQAKKELGTMASWLSSYNNSADRLIVDFRNLKERVDKQDFKFSITHPSIPDKGSVLSLSKKYGKLVEDYNRLQ